MYPSRNALVSVCLLAVLSLALAIATKRPPTRARYSPAEEATPVPPRKAVVFELPEKEVTRSLPSGTLHIYPLQLGPGEFLHLRLVQQGVDLAVRLVDPTGELLYTVDSLNESQGLEEVFLLGGEVGGQFRAEVDAGGRAGTYSVGIEARRVATEADRGRAKALESLFVARGQQAAGRLEPAARGYLEALRLFESVGDWHWSRETALRLGNLSKEQGQHAAAEAYYRQALVFSLRAGDRNGESTALTLIGEELNRRGELRGAEAHLQAALGVAERIGNRTCQAGALSYLGEVEHTRGKHWQALNRHRQAIGLWRSLGRVAEVAKAQMRLGSVYVSLGEIDNGLDYYRMALPELEKAHDIVELGRLHSRIGEALIKEDETAEALRHFASALAFREEAGDLYGQAVTLQGRGLAHWLREDSPKARQDHERALAIFHRLKDPQAEARARLHIGVVDVQLGQPDRAAEGFQKALPALSSGEDREAEGIALYGLALAEKQRGNSNNARSLALKAIELVEQVRRDTVRSDLQALYFASKQDYYDLLLSLIAEEPGELGREGLELSERSRSRSLLDLLSSSAPPLADPELLAERQAMEARLERVEQDVLAREAEGKPTVDLDVERRSLHEEIKLLSETIRQSSPWVKRLTSPIPITLKEIQSELLDDDSVLLEYFVGKRRSYLWVVSRSSVHVSTLPGHAILEERVRPLARLLETSHMKGARRRLQRQLRSLSQLLLGPAAAHLGGKRLVIVPHGPLLSVPFAALPAPHGRQAVDGWEEPLVARQEIVQLPSMSVLKILRANHARNRPATRQIAVFADPFLPRASEDPTARFLPLPQTRKEAEEIRKLAGEGDVFMALGRKANKDVVESGLLSEFRFMHFGTHLRLEPALPELSGLVLSSTTEDGRPVDGFLRPYEISNLKLRAELVVLAACRTALGREIPGEGRLGLTQAFFHAGASRVIQSLWDVDDEATAEMIKRFYRGLLQENLPPTAALRQAQVEMWKSSRWRPPGYWGGFFIEGDWR